MRKRLIAILIAGCSSAAIAGEPGWTVSETSGPVQIGHAGMSKVATRGLGVAAGDTVSTGPGGRAVLVRGTEYMMVAANSRLRLPAEQKAGGFTQMMQDFGNVVFMIKKKVTPHFEVKTPYLAAVVKGTTFSVGVTPKGASVQVLEGAVDVGTPDGGAHELLRPGGIAMVGADDVFRMRIETDGVTKVVVSPAAPVVPASPSAATPAVETRESAAPAQPAIVVAVYEAPVSLSKVTGGLVSGSTGGSADVADLTKVADATRTATESSSSAVKAVEVAKQTIAADNAKDKSASDASKAADDAAKASANSEKADADKAAKDAAKDAAKAAKDAADKAAKDAADAAEQAAKDADEAAKKAAKAAEDAEKDGADDAAKDAAKAAKEASDKAAKDAAKAADEAAKAAADKAKKAAEDAAKAAEQEAARAAAEQAKQAEKDAKDAKKAAEDAAKAADEAAKRAKKDADDAAKAAEDALKGKKGGK